MRLLIALIVCVLIPSASADVKWPVGANPVAAAKEDFHRGNLERALATLDRLEKTSPAMPEALDLRGSIYMEQGKFEEARKAFSAAHAADPGIVLPRLHLGDLLLRQKKWAEAREAYEAAKKDTRIQIASERLRFGILLTYLGEQNEVGAKKAFDWIVFPTETPAYYFAQAAWAFAHGKKREGRKWIVTAEQIFDERQTAWFVRPLHELGWIRRKPSPASE